MSVELNGIEREELENYLNQLLRPEIYQDYAPNGLQVEGKKFIKTIAFSVSASFDSIKESVIKGADALIVHHGLFWKHQGAKPIVHSFARRIVPLIQNSVNLFAYHLPLDGHPEIGNATSLFQLMEQHYGINWENIQGFGEDRKPPIGAKAIFPQGITLNQLETHLTELLDHPVMVSSPRLNPIIHSLGIITGGANREWRLAQEEGLDAYLTGEMSEYDWHEAKEENMIMLAGGHHATEQFGVQSLMQKIEKDFYHKGLKCFYIPSANPA